MKAPADRSCFPGTFSSATSPLDAAHVHTPPFPPLHPPSPALHRPPCCAQDPPNFIHASATPSTTVHPMPPRTLSPLPRRLLAPATPTPVLLAPFTRTPPVPAKARWEGEWRVGEPTKYLRNSHTSCSTTYAGHRGHHHQHRHTPRCSRGYPENPTVPVSSLELPIRRFQALWAASALAGESGEDAFEQGGELWNPLRRMCSA